MKIFFSIILLSFLFNSVSQSQDLTFERIGGDTTYGKPDPIEPINAYAYFKNNTSQTIQIRMVRTVNNLPNGQWLSSICYGYCYAPFIDVVPDTTIDPFSGEPFEDPVSLLPGQQDTMDVTVNAGTEGTAHVVIRVYDVNDASRYTDANFWIVATTTNIQQTSTIVEDYKLSQNFPNPFNPNTQINFSIPKNEVVSLKVYDMLGNEVASLLNNESLSAGSYNYDFNAGSFNLTSGVYFYKLSTSEFTDMKKMMLIK